MQPSANYQEGAYSAVLLQELKLTNNGVIKFIFVKKSYLKKNIRIKRLGLPGVMTRASQLLALLTLSLGAQ